MTAIRAIGIVGGGLGLFLLMRLFGQRKITRFSFVFFSLVGSCLLAISLFPSSMNIVSDLIFPGRHQYTRLFTLLILSSLCIWTLLVYERSKAFRRGQQINMLVTKLGVEEFMRKHPQFKKFKSILVIIPALNESNNLRMLLPQVPKSVSGKEIDVLIIDDGSTDDTMQVCHAAGVYVARNLINMGGGLALQLGFELASRGSTELVITMDADGQHNPNEMEGLINPVIKHEADIVIGSRIKGTREKDSIIRYWGIHIFSMIINFISGTAISDCSNGYRCIRTDVVKFLNLRQEQYHTSELIIEASKKGFIIKEVPITVLKRRYGESKKGKNWRYGANFAKSILKSWWR